MAFSVKQDRAGWPAQEYELRVVVVFGGQLLGGHAGGRADALARHRVLVVAVLGLKELKVLLDPPHVARKRERRRPPEAAAHPTSCPLNSEH